MLWSPLLYHRGEESDIYSLQSLTTKLTWLMQNKTIIFYFSFRPHRFTKVLFYVHRVNSIAVLAFSFLLTFYLNFLSIKKQTQQSKVFISNRKELMGLTLRTLSTAHFNRCNKIFLNWYRHIIRLQQFAAPMAWFWWCFFYVFYEK